MGAMLGFDPALLTALDAAMRRCLTDLDAVRCDDVAASSPMQRVNRCRALLRDTWLPFTTGLLACRALDGYRPVSVDPGDLLGAWAAAVVTHPGWQLRADAGSPAAVPLTAQQATALGTLLSGPAGSEPFDDREVAWLAEVLTQIAAPTDLTSAFLPAFTTTGWTAVCNALARDRQLQVTAALYDGRITAAEHAAWAGIDTAFAALGAMVVANREQHPLSRPTLLLDDMTPLAAAMLAQHFDLDAAALADLTRTLVQRERILIAATAETQLGPRAADVLFGCLLRTPGASTAYVLATRSDPSLLLEVAFDPALGARVAVEGTDPANMNVHDAAATVPNLVRWFLDAAGTLGSMTYNPALAATAADVIAPYLLPLLRSSNDGWGLSRRIRRAIQQLVIGDYIAFAHLLAQRERIAATLANPLTGDAESRIAAVRDIADLLAFIDTMQRARTIQRAEAERAEWDLMWTLLGYGQNLLKIGGVAAAVLSSAVGALRIALDEAGWAPGDVPGARADSLATFDRLTTVAAATLVATTFDEMVADGRIRAGTPLPPVPDLANAHRTDVGAHRTDVGASYSQAFATWLATSGLDSAVLYELAAIKQAMASDHETTADANDGVLGN